ncbi:immunity 26/phosphotriesterase HocA family protein [Serratia ficaria]|uniref:immunity 26/phosphotriesterase HocA family protein n=1 Tax=Serratia ficaria TaxID=61651 RepID=UPI0021BCFE2C|nr:immunity 26/phosphotriesterase HocA family protein [Serratia ficaria]
MDKLKFWSWDKKPRTMLRFIKPGDVFCFQLSDDKFGFGKIISKVSIGHSAEIFNEFSHEPCIKNDSILNSSSVSFPVILDSYSLFDKKISGEWRIIGHQDDINEKKYEGIYFVYGAKGDLKKVDMLGNVSSISDKDSEKYRPYMPSNDFHVKNMLSI